MFSRSELANAIQFVSPAVERVDFYYAAPDDGPPWVRILVATMELEALGEEELAAVCFVVRDFVPPGISVEVCTVGSPIVLGRGVVEVLT